CFCECECNKYNLQVDGQNVIVYVGARMILKAIYDFVILIHFLRKKMSGIVRSSSSSARRMRRLSLKMNLADCCIAASVLSLCVFVLEASGMPKQGERQSSTFSPACERTEHDIISTQVEINATSSRRPSVPRSTMVTTSTPPRRLSVLLPRGARTAFASSPDLQQLEHVVPQQGGLNDKTEEHELQFLQRPPTPPDAPGNPTPSTNTSTPFLHQLRRIQSWNWEERHGAKTLAGGGSGAPVLLLPDSNWLLPSATTPVSVKKTPTSNSSNSSPAAKRVEEEEARTLETKSAAQ
ncbi:unnamed protein product, partial [Amoebophrya sp. A25]